MQCFFFKIRTRWDLRNESLLISEKYYAKEYFTALQRFLM